MAVFIKTSGYYPKVGDYVRGRNGKRIIEGYVLESKHKKGKPAIFQRWGFVGLWIYDPERNRKTVINEIEKI